MVGGVSNQNQTDRTISNVTSFAPKYLHPLMCANAIPDQVSDALRLFYMMCGSSAPSRLKEKNL